MPGQRIFFEGTEYLSTAEAASLLGTSDRTVRRYLRSGLLAATDIPQKGVVGQHWFPREQVEALAALRDQGKLPPVGGGMSQTGRLPFSAFTGHERRSLRRVDDDWLSPADERDGVNGDYDSSPHHEVAPLDPLVCPRCGSEVEFRSLGIAGARADLNEAPFCTRCNRQVDFSAPVEVDENACPVCQAELTWEWKRGPEGAYEVAMCATHGDVVPLQPTKKRVEEVPFRHQATFPAVSATSVTSEPRRRGRYLVDPWGLGGSLVNGDFVRRAPKPVPKPKLTFIDPIPPKGGS